ncbi:MAG TPA: hypothetical protein VMH81_03085 [Bryobacteraceae bacterium]|nr:hypothetical protein [Bryobacteraceae bacterium]
MPTEANLPQPKLFEPSPHLTDAVNRNIVQSEMEGGVHLRDVLPGTILEVETENRAYRIRYEGCGRAFISGHPVFCPEPTLVTIHGSTWGGSMIKSDYIGRGMHLEFAHPTYLPITTSMIVQVRAEAVAAR